MIERGPFVRGSRVVIPAGTPYTTTYPGVEGWRRFKRSQTVTVDWALLGYTSEEGKVVPPQIVYAGSGGYWKYVQVTDELLARNGKTEAAS